MSSNNNIIDSRVTPYGGIQLSPMLPVRPWWCVIIRLFWLGIKC